VYVKNSKHIMWEIMVPYLKPLILEFLECLSEFESNVWGQAEQELKNDQALNDMWIEASKYGPLADILQFCKDLLNEDSFKEVVLEVVKVAKRGVGIATRAGAANFLMEMSVERQDLITEKNAWKI